ncbi:3-oxoacyl-ACP synthase [Leptotrichia sp. OH3620_COT-345]|uniref:3-oxoacyl-[acyl-carrier-protein] synthase III C-terminal domain-containing protein n=1 Tax=Leptotrichia sp. OH3620_COT-345 TaxID=2491048 RepID=UPI000F650C5E|nr:3-oxoacyl-[acyl-carrier-protein] synthase III C-terminal domain-containing protein [Leptotrichia sp. OH3620_COT-345]RRD39552.1 3-oxoacyl-ACP synthase [Leptotrichia sp. OH3620_COT-345]
MKKLEIIGYGTAFPKNTVKFGNDIRYKIEKSETQLELAVEACKKAIKKSEISIEEIDCIVWASAVGVQPIPCTAALIHERIAFGTDIPALDINTTCTSFITALDMMSYLIEAGRYKTVLIVSCDVASIALNPEQKESYELFSDGGAAVILRQSEKDKGIISAIQKTWSEGAHSTEIRGGLSNLHPKNYSGKTEKEFMFDMNGKTVLSLSIKKIPDMVKEFLHKGNITIDDIDMVIPHQASMAMPFVMEKLGIPQKKYINLVREHGNMVSASVPVTLCTAFDRGIIKSGDIILLIGTAAGLTTNLVIMKI